MATMGDVHVKVVPEVQSPVTDAMALAAAVTRFNAVLTVDTVKALTSSEANAVVDLQRVMRRITTQAGYFNEEENP